MIKRIKMLVHLLKNPPNPNWHIEKEAFPSKSHPLGGFWKKDKRHEHGLAIGKADGQLYFISFCGPGGCFEKDTYRPNTKIEGDTTYRVIDQNTIEVKGKRGFEKYFRVKSRTNK